MLELTADDVRCLHQLCLKTKKLPRLHFPNVTGPNGSNCETSHYVEVVSLKTFVHHFTTRAYREEVCV